MNKHAYLIMAHGQFRLLNVLLRMLDYEQNDFFLHIDKKAGKINLEEIGAGIRHSNLHILKERLDVQWGTFSQVECTLRLLEEAVGADCVWGVQLFSFDVRCRSPLETCRGNLPLF